VDTAAVQADRAGRGVITGMEAPGDARRAQELEATGFMAKPFTFAKLVEMARQIHDTWLRPARRLEPG